MEVLNWKFFMQFYAKIHEFSRLSHQLVDLKFRLILYLNHLLKAMKDEAY